MRPRRPDMQVPNARAIDLTDRSTSEPRPVPHPNASVVDAKPDRIDRSLPQGDIYFAWAKGAAWDAFFLRKDFGMAHGIGPKPPEQMAFVIKRALQRAADRIGVPITFHATRSGDHVRISGRDANDSGPDVVVSKNARVDISTTQYGVKNQVLGMAERWSSERHDTGHLEKHSVAWPNSAPWMPAYPESNMTGKDL